jgi:CubicO group peptidase (beta-lactamase class C family)
LWSPDAYVERPRVIVMTDIANEPDDQMSLVRFLLYSNQWDVEGLVATTSTWLRDRVRPDVVHSVLDAYEKVQPNLLKHAPGFPTAAALRALVVPGQPGYGMAAVGEGKDSAGAELILRAAGKEDPRPLWVLAWGGANTLAQALSTARARRTPAELHALVAKLRVYAISDQDDAGAWLRREFPGLGYVAHASTQNGEEYYLATWTGISGDVFYRNAPGADFTTFTDEWVNANVRAKGPLGALYPHPCCIHEGDTPSFLGLIDNGLASAMSPAFGGWGGRYVWRQPHGETRPFWTQGGDSYPGNDSSRDTVTGTDGKAYTSDPATIWRWRTAFQNDFAARMDWTTRAPAEANHNPRVVVNGRPGTEPLVIDAVVGSPVTLDAAGTTDPDGHALRYTWLFYPEAGTGIPGQPVRVREPRPEGTGAGEPPPPLGMPPQPPPRVAIENASSPRATVIPKVPGIAHVILAVEDDGQPSLTSYRRVILRMTRAPKPSESPDVEKIDAAVRSFMEREKVGAAHVTVIGGGRTLLERGYGSVGPGSGPPDSRSVFPVGSISKHFTAAAIVALADEGKLRLDAPVGDYLPEWFAGEPELRVSHLLTPTSGGADFLWLEGYRPLADDPATPKSAFLALAAAAPRRFGPGERWAYSNSNFKALALIAERVAGKPFDVVLEERVLRPAGVEGILPCHDLAAGGFVAGYAPTGKPAPLDASRAAYAGDGGLCASAAGLADWVRKAMFAQGGTELEIDLIGPLVFLPAGPNRYVARDYPATFLIRLPDDGSRDSFELDWGEVRSYARRIQG